MTNLINQATDFLHDEHIEKTITRDNPLTGPILVCGCGVDIPEHKPGEAITKPFTRHLIMMLEEAGYLTSPTPQPRVSNSPDSEAVFGDRIEGIG